MLTIIQREQVDSKELRDMCDELDMDRQRSENLGDETESNIVMHKIVRMDSLSVSRRYDKFLDKIQHREAEL